MPSPRDTFYRLLLVATAINVLGLPFAVFRAEPVHATVHAVLALGCAFWVSRIRQQKAAQLALKASREAAELEAGSQGLGEEWLRDESPEASRRREQ